MSTSGMNKTENKKKIFANRPVLLVLLAGLCVAIDNIYAIFGHGVRSNYMSFMFLYPLGGAVVYLVLRIILPSYAAERLSRFGANSFNSGLATLTLGSFLQGIMEIAGTSSIFVLAFFIVGWVFAGFGLLLFIYIGVVRK